MRFVLAASPAAVSAVAMLLCFRMMRQPDVPAEGPAESVDLDSFRKELGVLREELVRARSTPLASGSDGVGEILERGPSDVAPDESLESALRMEAAK